MQWRAFSLKTKPNLALSRQMWRKSKIKQKVGHFWKKKRLFSKKFHISFIFNHSYRNTKKQREKSWQDVSVNISQNIPTITETMTYKYSVFTGTVKPYWKLRNTQEWKSCNNEIFFIKWVHLLLKYQWFSRYVHFEV